LYSYCPPELVVSFWSFLIFLPFQDVFYGLTKRCLPGSEWLKSFYHTVNELITTNIFFEIRFFYDIELNIFAQTFHAICIEARKFKSIVL